MPAFLERKLKKEYPNNPVAVYGTMNKIGAMRGNKETAKGRMMTKRHQADALKRKMMWAVFKLQLNPVLRLVLKIEIDLPEILYPLATKKKERE